jgi:hypothetical protein
VIHRNTKIDITERTPIMKPRTLSNDLETSATGLG